MPDNASQVVKLNYSVEEAAEALGISERLCRKWIAEDRIPSHKLGNRRLVPARELERWNAEHAAGWTEEQRTWRAS